MKLLLLSSSRAGNSAYLAPYMAWLKSHLQGVDELLFIPYAGVSIEYDAYQAMVQQALLPLGITVTSIHQHSDARQAVLDAKAIAVGGGDIAGDIAAAHHVEDQLRAPLIMHHRHEIAGAIV